MTDGTRFRVLGIRADGKERKKKLHRYVHCRLRLFFHFANLGRRIVEMAKKRQATPQYARGPRPFHSYITLLLCII